MIRFCDGPNEVRIYFLDFFDYMGSQQRANDDGGKLVLTRAKEVDSRVESHDCALGQCVALDPMQSV